MLRQGIWCCLDWRSVRAEWETAAYYLFLISAYMAGCIYLRTAAEPSQVSSENPLGHPSDCSWKWQPFWCLTCTGIRTGADFTGCGQLYCFYAVQYVSSGQRERRWRQLFDKPYPPGRCGLAKEIQHFRKKIKTSRENGANIA